MAVIGSDSRQQAFEREDDGGMPPWVPWVVGALAVMVLARFIAAAVAPVLVWRFRERLAERAEFWYTPKQWQGVERAARWAGPVLAVLVVLVLVPWLGSISYGLPFYVPIVLSLVAGLGFVPWSLSLARRQMAGRVDNRRIGDVVRQEVIEQARRRAADQASADALGLVVTGDGKVKQWQEPQREPEPEPQTQRVSQIVSMTTGEVVGATSRQEPQRPAAAMRPPLSEEKPQRVPVVPHQVGGAWLLGLVQSDTTRSVTARWREDSTRRVRGWVQGGSVVLPEKPGDVRAVVVAESGAGKSQLLDGMLLSAHAAGWRTFMIDAKGQSADMIAREMRVRALEESGQVQGVGYMGPRRIGAFDLFAGGRLQLLENLGRLWPESGSDADHYRREGFEVAEMLLPKDKPLPSTINEFLARFRAWEPWVQSQADHDYLSTEVRKGATRVQVAGDGWGGRLKPLEAYGLTPGTGIPSFSWRDFEDDVTPFSPLMWTLGPRGNGHHATIGDAAISGLAGFMGERALSGASVAPLLVIIDEFGQFVRGTTDPADVASGLFELARTAGIGLVIAGQSPSTFSLDEKQRQRMFSSGASIIAGRSNAPEEVAALAGTIIRQEASGDAEGLGLAGARAQHSYAVSPNEIRSLSDGSWVMISGGGVVRFRGLPSGV